MMRLVESLYVLPAAVRGLSQARLVPAGEADLRRRARILEALGRVGASYLGFASLSPRRIGGDVSTVQEKKRKHCDQQ